MIDDLLTLERRVKRLESMEVGAIPGTYTPTMIGASTAGVTTYTTQIGYYICIGSVVIAYGMTVWTNATGTGDAIYSLPFAAENLTNGRFAVAIRTSALTYTATSGLQGLILPNTSYFIVTGQTANAAAATLAVEVAGEVDWMAVYVRA